VRIDEVIAREFLTRCAASLGIFHAPLEWKDFAAIAASGYSDLWGRLSTCGRLSIGPALDH